MDTGSSAAAQDETEAVEDDEDGAAFVAQDAEGQGNSAGDGETCQDDNRAEGEDEILADDGAGANAELMGGEKVFQAIVHEDDVGLFKGCIGTPGAHGHPDVCGRKGGGVIDAIPDHGDVATGLGERGDRGDLFVRFEFGPDLVEREFLLQVPACRLAVACEDDRRKAQGAEARHDVPGLGPDVVAKEDSTQDVAVAHPDFGDAGLGRGISRDPVRELGGEDEFAAAEGGGFAIDLATKPEAGDRFELMDLGRVEGLLFAISGDSPGERVEGLTLEGIGERRDEPFVARWEAFDLRDAEFSGCEGAGLVHGNNVDFGEFFDGGPAAEQNALASAPCDGREDGGGYGEHEGAGGSDDQEGHGEVECAALIICGGERGATESGPPDEEHDHGETESGEGIAGSEAVGESLGRRLHPLRLMDQVDDALEGTLGGGPGDDPFDGAPEVEGAAEHGVSDAFVDGNSLAGEVGFICGGGSTGDLGVDRKQLTGFDDDPHAGGEGIHRDAVLRACLVEDGGVLGGGANQGPDFAMGPAECVVFESTGEREQEEQGGTFLPGADGGGSRGDGEHEEVDVESSFLKAFPDFDGREPATGKVGDQEWGDGDGGGTEGPTGDTGDGAENGGGELRFPFVLLVFAFGQMHLAWNESRQGKIAPPPETGSGGAGDAGDGGGAGLMVDREPLRVGQAVRMGAFFAIPGTRQQGAGVFCGGVADGLKAGSEAIRDGAVARGAERGHGEGASGPIDADGFERRVALHFVGHELNEASIFGGTFGAHRNVRRSGRVWLLRWLASSAWSGPSATHVTRVHPGRMDYGQHVDARGR